MLATDDFEIFFDTLVLEQPSRGKLWVEIPLDHFDLLAAGCRTL